MMMLLSGTAHAACEGDACASVVYAAHELQPGIPIGADDLEVVPTSRDYTIATTATDPEQVVGRVPRERILAGEPVRFERLGRPGVVDARIVEGMSRTDAPDLAGIRPPAYRGWWVDVVLVDGPRSCSLQVVWALRPLPSDPTGRGNGLVVPPERLARVQAHQTAGKPVQLALRSPIDITSSGPSCDKPEREVRAPRTLPTPHRYPNARIPGGPKVSILSGADLHHGLVIRWDDLFVAERPEHAHPSWFRPPGLPMVGAVPIERILVNEVIRPERLFAPRDTEVDSWIPMGMRAIHVAEPDLDGVAHNAAVRLVKADASCTLVAEARVLRVDPDGSIAPGATSGAALVVVSAPDALRVLSHEGVRAKVGAGPPACPD